MNRSMCYKAGISLMILLFFVSVSFAQPIQKPISLEEMVVTASRTKEEKKYLTSNVTIIDKQEIERSSARDLGELLAEKGIGHIHKYPGTLTSVGIRGFRTDTTGNDLQGHVLVLLDGRRAGTGNLAKILTKNIERIEIIRGPGSVQYGSAGIGGIINVITKRGKGKPKASLSGLFGSFGYEEGTAEFSGKKGKFDWSASVTVNKMDDYRSVDGKYHNSGYDKKQSISINAGYEFLPQNRISIIYHYFKVDHQGSPEYFTRNDLDDYTDKRNESVDFIYEGAIPDLNLISWRIRYFKGQDKDRWVSPAVSDPTGWDVWSPYNKQTTDQQGVQAQLTLDWKCISLVAGYDWVDYDVENAVWNPKQTSYKNPAYFLLSKLLLLNNRLILKGGFRFDEYTLEVEKGQGREEYDNHVSPTFGIAYLITDNIKLRLNYGEGFRMPSAQQMAADYVVWGVRTKGNPDLDPEKSETYEAGFDISYPCFDFSFTYFHTRFKDKIEGPFFSATLGYNTWENIGSAVIEGVEGSFSFDIASYLGWGFELKPYANFVHYTRYEDLTNDRDLYYVSDSYVSYGISFSGKYGIVANLNLSYTGEQTVQDWSRGIWPAPVVKKGGFTVADFTITKEVFRTKYGKFGLRGEIRNLFDKDYEYVKGYPMPERSFFIGLKFSL